MASHANDRESGKYPPMPRTGGPVKRAYHSPKLVEYGDIKRLTAGHGGTRGDSTPPGGKSRT
jgi:hypothetical protein